VGMILCHCTTTAPEAIEAEGLKPGQDSCKDWRDLLGPNTPEENVVWLTANCCVVRRPTKWAYHLRMPSSDRKLVRSAKLLNMARLPSNLTSLHNFQLGTSILERSPLIASLKFLVRKRLLRAGQNSGADRGGECCKTRSAPPTRDPKELALRHSCWAALAKQCRAIVCVE
jgi:hypothetical protein